MASTMLHEKCCNTVLQIGAPIHGAPDIFCVSQAPQTMYESPTARAVHGTSRVVWGRLEYIKVGVLVGLATAVV